MRFASTRLPVFGQNSDLFLNQLKYVPSHNEPVVPENFFTASLVGTLNESLGLRRAFFRVLNGNANTWRDRPIGTSQIDILFQPSYVNSAKRRLRPDVVFVVNGTDCVGVEIKLGSPEGVDNTGRRQLSCYLDLIPKDLTHLAFITGYHCKVADEVIGEPRYLRPADRRDHFLWSDFYPAVREHASRSSNSVLSRALLRLMEALHFQPLHPIIKDLGGKIRHELVSDEVRERREWIRERWRPTIDEFDRRGFGGQRVRNNGEFYRWPTRAPWLVWVDPRLIPGSLRIWLRFLESTGTRNRRRVLDAVKARLRLPTGTALYLPTSSATPGIDIRIPYRTLLSRARNDESIERSLKTIVFNVVDIASAELGSD